MKSTIELTDRQISSLTHTNEARGVAMYAPPLGMHIFMGISALIGTWGMICLMSGLSTAASLPEAGRTMITAITGI